MNWHETKLISLLLAVCLLLSACFTEPPVDQYEESSKQTTNPLSEIILTENGLPCFDIVYSADSGYENLSVWIKQVQTALQKRTEVSFRAYNDFKEPKSKRLILIGDTKYSESAIALHGLGAGGFSVTQNGDHIVINGKDSAGMVKAVNRFCNTMLAGVILSDDNKSARLPFEAVSEVGEPFPELSVEGTPISAYTIVYPNGEDQCEDAARTLRAILNEKCGISLSISDDNSTQHPFEILVGYTNRVESQTHFLEDEIQKMEYGYHVINKKISIQGYKGSGYGLFEASKTFVEKTLFMNKTDLKEGYMLKTEIQLKEDVNADLTVGAEIRVMTANIESEEWGGTAVQPRAEILYANLTYYTPDVVGLQEVSIQWKDAIQSIFEGSEYTLLHEVVQGTDSNYCPIMYNTATVEPIESDARRLSIGGPVKARTVTWGVFRHLESGKTFIVINTHLDWTKTPNDFVSQGATTPYSREQQVREIAEIFSTLKKKYSNAEIMLTADWNTMKNEHPLNILTELTGVTYAEDVATGHDWENEVDHIFIYPDAEIKKLYLYAHNAKDLGVSDHPWGFADLALR